MAIWTTLPDAALEPGKPIRSIDGLALRDNPIAIANGASGAPRIQTAGIQDSAVTTAKLANDNVTTAKLASNERMNTGNVLAATAGGSTGGVGTYAFAGRPQNTGPTSGNQRNPGDTEAGSNLNYSNMANSLSSSLAAGTWRCMGFMQAVVVSDPYLGISTSYRATLWLRIS